MVIAMGNHRGLSWAGRKLAYRGFTLIELLVVLSLIALLLTLALPRYFNQIDAAKEAVLRDNLARTRQVIGNFYTDHGRYPDSLEELLEKRYLRTLPTDPITDSSGTWMIESVPDGYKGRVYDVRSGAPGTGRNGVPYAKW